MSPFLHVLVCVCMCVRACVSVSAYSFHVTLSFYTMTCYLALSLNIDCSLYMDYKLHEGTDGGFYFLLVFKNSYQAIEAIWLKLTPSDITSRF